MFMNMSIDALNYAVKLRKRYDALNDALKYIHSGNHGNVRATLPTGPGTEKSGVEVYITSLTQQNLLQLEIDKVKKEIVHLTSSDPPKKEIIK